MATSQQRVLAILACALGARAMHTTSVITNRFGGPCNASQSVMSFVDFVERFQRPYLSGTPEYFAREDRFRKSVESVRSHNCGPRSSIWTAAINHLADWTESELAGLRGYKRQTRKTKLPSLVQHTLALSGAREAEKRRHKFMLDTFSWSGLQSITESRDQLSCGSCWAFAAEVTMRSRHELATGNYTAYAVQELVSCVLNPNQCGGTGGCMGATCELAFDYILGHGVSNESALPYSATDGTCTIGSTSNCTIQSDILSDGTERHTPTGTGCLGSSLAGLGMTGWVKFPENKFEPLLQALHQGPVAVSIAAGNSWNSYGGGILAGDGDWVVNHAVVLFGYGVSGSSKYWSIKNSWGNSWGENGNIRLSRSDDEENNCGMDHSPEVGTGCLGGPSEVEVCGTSGILYDTSAPLFG